MEVKGKVDFGIITIREDEFEAVLHYFPEVGRVAGLRQYNLRRVELANGASYLVAVLRCIEQGNGEAQDAARDLLEDLNPQWLLVVGIAGAAPAAELGLGDVIVSTRILDFSVEAVLHGEETEYSLTGGAVDKRAGAVAANLPALKAELGSWNSAESIAAKRPAAPTLESVQAGEGLYGDEEWRDKVLRALSRHAERAQPVVTAGAIASSDRLLKSPEPLSGWLKVARHILAVEMESAGVHRAASGRQVPTLSIRGISDVVGLKRDPAWIPYACYTAAAFTLALLKTGPIKPREARRTALAEFSDEATRTLSEQIEDARLRKARLQAAGEKTSAIDKEIVDLRRLLRDGGQVREGYDLGDGRYLLLRRLGRGGFASVWEADDEQTHQRVAIKVLHSDLASDRTKRERFFRGARVMSELAHPAIAKVLEPYGYDGTFYYFVMELVPGGDLRDAVLSGRLASDAVIPLILRVGEALAKAHERGFVHRDIKPANILLDEEGAPRLTDFDLVAGLDTTGGTRTGAMGTVFYAAPELMDRPQDAGPKADVYSLGMTTLFGLYGHDLTHNITQDAERGALISRLPCNAAVQSVLERAVSRHQEERYPDAASFCSALQRALVPRKLVVAPRPPPGRGLTFEAKVTWNQRDPILKLPSRATHPEVPLGEVEVQIPGGGAWQFRLMKEFCNVAKPVDAERNRLPELLRRWFGPQAGHPGTAFRVRFTRAEGGWTVAPVQQAELPHLHIRPKRGNGPLLAWIHLSDLYFGAGPSHRGVAQEDVLQAVRRDVAEAYPHKAPGFIFVSGDTAFTAHPEEYKSAERWLRDLLEAAQASPAALRIVPGNHDVDRALAGRQPFAALHRDIRAQWRSLDRYLDGKERWRGQELKGRDLLSEKLSQYVSFVKRVAPNHPIGAAGSVLDWSERHVLHKGRRGALRIAGLNSVWVSDAGDAERKLILGEHSLQELDAAGPDDLLIVLTHHPLSWLHDESQRLLLERMTEKRPYLHLCGHVHDRFGNRCERLGGRKLALHLVAGAVRGDPRGGHFYSWGAIQWRDGRWDLGWAPRIHVEGQGMRPDTRNYELDDAGFLWEPIELPWEPPPHKEHQAHSPAAP